MSELAVTLLRLSYLALLWVFVFAAISVLRQDLFSATRVTQRGRGARADSTRARSKSPVRSMRRMSQRRPSNSMWQSVVLMATGWRQGLTKPPRHAGGRGM